MKILTSTILTAAVLALASVQAHPLPMLSYQGRVVVDGINFEGVGLFKFALVNVDGSQTYWSNDGSSTGGGEPTDTVKLKVVKGLYAVLLGDAELMSEIDPALFASNPDARLRIWFNDGSHGFQLLTPDQPLASVGYAMSAATVPDRSIGTDQLDNGAVTAVKIGTGQVGSAQLAGSLTITGTMQASVFSGSFAGNGAGLTGVSGTFQWQEATSTTTGLPNCGYAVMAAARVEVTLPATGLNIGDRFRVSGVGAGGWRITQSGGHRILTDTLGDVPGRIWTPRESNPAWGAVASSADGTKLAAVVYGGQVYTSADAGVTWTPRESNRNWRGIASSADGVKLAAVVQNGQIYTSTNSGVSWTVRESSRNWFRIASAADGTKLAAVVYNGQIYTSTNSGVNWTARESNRNWYAIASSSNGTNLATVVWGGQIYTSTNSGANWTSRESDRNWTSIASSAAGTKLAAMVDSGQIYTSTDSGISWTARDAARSWDSVASSADGTRLAAVAWGGQIYTSTNSGAIWTPRDSNRQWISIASSADGARLVAAVQNGGRIYTSTICTLNSISGGQGTALELQYIGNNTWMPLSFIGSFTFD